MHIAVKHPQFALYDEGEDLRVEYARGEIGTGFPRPRKASSRERARVFRELRRKRSPSRAGGRKPLAVQVLERGRGFFSKSARELHSPEAGAWRLVSRAAGRSGCWWFENAEKLKQPLLFWSGTLCAAPVQRLHRQHHRQGVVRPGCSILAAGCSVVAAARRPLRPPRPAPGPFPYGTPGASFTRRGRREAETPRRRQR